MASNLVFQVIHLRFTMALLVGLTISVESGSPSTTK